MNRCAATLQEPPDGQMLIYNDGATRLQVRLEGRMVWLAQRLMAELFQVSVKTVNEHLVNIYGEGELDPGATVRSFRIVQTEDSRGAACCAPTRTSTPSSSPTSAGTEAAR